jgi:hypothetical protein
VKQAGESERSLRAIVQAGRSCQAARTASEDWESDLKRALPLKPDADWLLIMNALPPFLLRLARFGLFVTMACLIPTFSNADEIHLSLLPTGAMSRMGGYMPQRLKLSSEMPAEIKQIPPGIKVPLFGVLKLGPPEAPTVVAVILDESEGKPPRLFVEAAANGDLRAAQPATWTARVNKLKDGSDSTVYMGGASASRTSSRILFSTTPTTPGRVRSPSVTKNTRQCLRTGLLQAISAAKQGGYFPVYSCSSI